MSKDEHNQQDLDRLFQQKLAGHSVAPPADMWAKVNANTAENKKRRAALWIIINDTTIMLIVLAISIFGMTGVYNTTNASQHAVDSQPEKTESETPPFPESENKTIEHTTVTLDDNASHGESALNSSADDVPTTATFNAAATNTAAGNRPTANQNDSQPMTTNGTASNTLSGAESSMEPDEDNRTQADEILPNDGQAAFAGSDDPSDPYDEKTGIPLNEKEEKTNAMLAEEWKWKQINVIVPFLFTELLEDTLTPLSIPETPQDLTGTPNHEIYGGVHANFNLPLIFNQNTYGAFNGKELAYKPTFGMATGVRIGYTLKRQYGIETGFIFYSRQGQDYEDKLNGTVARRQVKLQYFHVPLVLRYKFKIKKQQRFESPWVINLGADIGILRSATITYSGNEYPLGTILNPEINDKDYFSPIDASVVLGVEKEFYFTKWLMLSVGMRTTFSDDINAKDHPVVNDSNYDKSHNFTFGFTLGLNYYMRR